MNNKLTLFNKYILRNGVLNNSKLIPINIKKYEVGKLKYFSPVASEWKNSIYQFNHNNMKNLPSIGLNINSLLKKYFNLQFLPGFQNSAVKSTNLNSLNKQVALAQNTDLVLNKVSVNNKKTFSAEYHKEKLRKQRKALSSSLNKIYVSKASIKHTNNKAILTVFVYNREKIVLLNVLNSLKKAYIYKAMDFISRFTSETQIAGMFDSAKSSVKLNDNKFDLDTRTSSGSLNLATTLRRKLLIAFLNQELMQLRKYKLKLSLNKSKFEENLLYRLSNLMVKYYNKKVEFNIINLKYFIFNSEIFSSILSVKLKDRKSSVLLLINKILGYVNLPKVNRLIETTRPVKTIDMNLINNKYLNPHLSSIIQATHSQEKLYANKVGDTQATLYTQSDCLSLLLKELYYKVNAQATNGAHEALLRLKAKRSSSIQPSNIKLEKDLYSENLCASDPVYDIIFNSINYKNMAGVRFEVKGRLTKRYRADRALFKIKWNGGLKNIDASYKGLSVVNYRGFVKPNLDSAIVTSKRRIGAFAVKGWLSGK